MDRYKFALILSGLLPFNPSWLDQGRSWALEGWILVFLLICKTKRCAVSTANKIVKQARLIR